MIKRYRSKPVEAEAIFFKEDGSNFDEIANFLGNALKAEFYEGSVFKYLSFDNDADGGYLNPGEYIVKEEGVFYAYGKEDFLEDYEEVL